MGKKRFFTVMLALIFAFSLFGAAITSANPADANPVSEQAFVGDNGATFELASPGDADAEKGEATEGEEGGEMMEEEGPNIPAINAIWTIVFILLFIFGIWVSTLGNTKKKA